MKKVYITGVPGIGKSTVAEELNKRGVFAFDIDFVEGLSAWRNKKTNEVVIGDVEYTAQWLAEHDWICNVEKLKEALKQDKEIIVAVGISANQAEYLDLFDKVFLLQCSEKTFLDRMAARKDGTAFGKSLVERQYVLNFYKDFEQKLVADGAIEVIVDNIISKIEKI